MPIYGQQGAKLVVLDHKIVDGAHAPAVRGDRRLRVIGGHCSIGIQCGSSNDKSCGTEEPPEPPPAAGAGPSDPDCLGPSSLGPVGPTGRRRKIISLNNDGVDEELLARLQCDAAFQEREPALIRRLHLRAMEYLRKEYDMTSVTWAQRHEICAKAALAAAMNPTPAELAARKLGAGGSRQRRRERAERLIRQGVIARPRWWQVWKPTNQLAAPRA
jgi:hypothetical protein